MRKDTYKLTNDVGRTSKGKNQQYEYQLLPNVANVQGD